MIPSVLAVLIYQILAFLGAEAVSQIVTYIAFRRRDLDFKLMYLQDPFELIFNYHRFDKTTRQKAIITFLSFFAIALEFIPTIFTKIHSTGFIYYSQAVIPFTQAEAIPKYNWSSTMPLYTNFVPYLTNPTATSLEDMTNEYIKENLRQNNTQNSVGHWFRPGIAKRFEWDNRQVGYPENFNGLFANGSVAQQTITAFGFRPGDSEHSNSHTMSQCRPADPTVVLTYIPNIYGHTVQAARAYDGPCYPIYDHTLSIVLSQRVGGAYQSSLLNSNDTIYRQMKLFQGTTASSSFGVNIFNHNSSHMTMGIKKTAHITLYSYNRTAIPPSDCSIGTRANFTNNFIDLPYNAVLCQLINARNSLNVSAALVQAAGRRYLENYVVNTVYTFQKGGMYDEGESIMVDFSLFQAFTVEGNLLDRKEHMVAYSSNYLQYDGPTNGSSTAADLSNDKIGSILTALDPSRISQETVDILAGMASMRVRWENGDYSDFSLHRAQVLDAVETPPWWIVAVVLLILFFLLPHASRRFMKSIPEYAESLRTLLLLTLERSGMFMDYGTRDGGKNRKAGNVGIFVGDGQDKEEEEEDDNNAAGLLSVNGYPITVADKSVETVENNFFIDKNTAFVVNEKYRQ